MLNNIAKDKSVPLEESSLLTVKSMPESLVILKLEPVLDAMLSSDCVDFSKFFSLGIARKILET